MNRKKRQIDEKTICIYAIIISGIIGGLQLTIGNLCYPNLNILNAEGVTTIFQVMIIGALCGLVLALKGVKVRFVVLIVPSVLIIVMLISRTLFDYPYGFDLWNMMLNLFFYIPQAYFSAFILRLIVEHGS